MNKNKNSESAWHTLMVAGLSSRQTKIRRIRIQAEQEQEQWETVWHTLMEARPSSRQIIRRTEEEESKQNNKQKKKSVWHTLM